MKYKYNILVGAIFVILIISIIQFCCRDKYLQAFQKMQNQRQNFRQEEPFIGYFMQHFSCPNNFEEVIPLPKSDPDFQIYCKRYFTDYLQRYPNHKILYLPVYNENNKNREAFLLLSAGIDGKINYSIPPQDSLFTSNWNSAVDIYNPNHYYAIDSIITKMMPPSYCLYDYLFGKKDYLIAYIDCIHYYRSQAQDSLSLLELVNKIENKKLKRKIIYYKGLLSSDTCIHNSRYIVFKDNGYIIYNQLYDWPKEETTRINDSISMIGTLEQFDYLTRTIKFKNCLPEFD